MKFKADRASLLKALAHVQSVVERRNTIPILANVMIAVRDNALSLTATDMEIAIVEDVPAVTLGPGACTAPAATLYDIVRKLPDGAEVELEHPGGEAQLSLRAGRYHTNLVVLPTDDFPQMTAGSLSHRFALSAQQLRGDHRPHPLRYQHRGDAVLPQRNLSPCRGQRRRERPAGGRHRRAPPGAGGGEAARGRGGDAGRDRAAQDGE